ncbi:MAG TPA: hypothetical protein VNJ08_07165 [Bacteriovoracaceae bacterium]|nr:hypothetical protein [Bacteriovoracaceae bacterium]
MKIMFIVLLAAFSGSVLAQDSGSFAGEWDFYKAKVVKVVETSGLGTWTSKSCESVEYIQSKNCVSSKTELFVYDQKLKGLCSVTAKEYCWTLLRIIPGPTRKEDKIIIKADPFYREPGMGYAISASRL